MITASKNDMKRNVDTIIITYWVPKKYCVKSSMIDIDRSMSLFFNVIVCNVFVKSRIVTRKVNLRQDDEERICIFHKKFSLFGY